MSGSFEKSVKGATKIKAAPPKTKYIEHILVATHSGEDGVGQVFRALQYRLRDSTWTVVFKGLITVHLMIREGRPDVTLTYLAKHPNVLALSPFTDAQTQGRNIRHYARYLTERSRAYKETRVDWVRAKETRLEDLSVDKGLLRETETVQRQLSALLACDVMEEDPENEITITVFRLLVLDLLALFQVLNQGLISILGHFFEMSKPDAERAMAIYRKFTKQTDNVVQYLNVARQFEHHTRVQVPKLKHAPVHLGRQLEEYLHAPDFETHRRQYLAELDAKKQSGRSVGSGISRLEAKKAASASKPVFSNPNVSQAESKPPQLPQSTKGPDKDLIDFFDSIEQNQTPMGVQPPSQDQTGLQYAAGPTPFQQVQATGFAGNGIMSQPTGFGATNPFQQQQQILLQQQQQQQQQQHHQQQQPQQQQPQQQQQQPQQFQQLPQMYTGFAQQAPQPLQQNFTGAGFGGFTPQPSFQPGHLGSIPQEGVASFPNGAPNQSLGAPQTTNPFRVSMMLGQQPTGQLSTLSSPTTNSNRLSTNPFALGVPPQAMPHQTGGEFYPQQQQFSAAGPLMPMATGTNPFAKTSPPPQTSPTGTGTPTSLAPQATGTTNPFRQSAFVNHTTGVGWQHNQMPIGGGLDQVPTIPVFPRPAQQAPWQQ